eukprot:gene5602-6021_t
MKYIVVTGGVVSGLGKGITISSIGRILKSTGLRVTAIKIDPYLNVDAGTMSPFEHGETFVLDDGGETDLDLGNYERFLDVTLTARHNMTSGKVYKEVIRRERRGDYLGKTVQIVPHVTDMIQTWIKEVSKICVDGSGVSPDVCLIEVGGTVGDIESMVFLEALRQFQFVVGRENIMFVHVSLVPVIGAVGEQKSKPTQHSVKELRALGLSPDLIICRSTEDLPLGTKQKISVFCHVPTANILSVFDVSNIYHVPLILEEQGLSRITRQHLQLQDIMVDAPDLRSWKEMAHIVDSFKEKVEIAIVGKYVGLQDSYLSLTKALKHSAILLEIDIVVLWIEAEHLEESVKVSDPQKYEAAWSSLKSARGILVPGGFGSRGCLGKVVAARYARENKIPYLGICLGMQIMVIEFARHVLNLEGANSTEFDESTSQPVVVFMPEINPLEMGGTMRLGARSTIVDSVATFNGESSRSLSSIVYGTEEAEGKSGVLERHRHRYEVNPEKVVEFESKGLLFTGRDESGIRMEIAELPRDVHPFYFGTQFHPEFKSRPGRPSPPFFAFAAVAAGRTNAIEKAGKLWQAKESELVSLSSPTAGSKRKRTNSGPFTPRSAGKTITEMRLPESSVVIGTPVKDLKN